ncbi:unnamed protein product [Coffea canephora]|uniref:DH200=94 genomic scaffold, scaffold_614 n=1 Tax=Coffea canephora TaxID=49390 RepID=A0A068VGJ2_COFCA|nr:unnamed protein product [Coffea canephora]
MIRLVYDLRSCVPSSKLKKGLLTWLQTDVEVLSSVFCYNIHTEEWPNCAPLSVPRYDFAGTVCDNKIYVAGGQSALAGARGTAAAEVYDPLTDKWAPLPNTNRLRCKSVGVTWRGKVHVVGGFVQSYYIDGCSAEVYNVQSGKWDLVSGHLFGSGDCLSAWKGHIEFDDGKLTTWNVVEGHLYFLAGYKVPGESSRTISMVHSFDTSATTATADHAWRSFEPIEEEGVRELCSHCRAVQLS